MKNNLSNNDWCGSLNWQSKKENFKARYPVLTDSDLVYETPGKESMLENLRTKLGMTTDELSMIIMTL
jgi:hypothetical protein